MTGEKNFDIAVIGGGPAGAIAAKHAAKKGVSVALFEEHSSIGFPEHCAGLISVSGIKRLNIDIPKNCILNKVKGATFYSPSGISFNISRKTPQAYVVNRPLLDQYLVTMAQKENVTLFTKYKVVALEMGEIKTLKINHDKKESYFNANVIIDAEGARGKIVRQAGLTSLPRSIIPGVQIEVKNISCNPDQVEMFFGNEVAPGFFAWIIPTGEDTARVGIGANRQALKYLKKFMKKHPIASEKLSDAVPIKQFGGRMIKSGPIPKTYTDGFLVVGDAAGQVKPTTCGGVVVGGLCAQIAGDVAAEAVIEGEVSSSKLREYQKKWKRLLSREFRLMLVARRLLDRMSDKNLDNLFKAIIKNDFPRDIEEVGDMDFESGVIKKVISKPKLSAAIILNLLESLLIEKK
ncbi:MAG: NAD(P)/FAD-dependent oxidoreductase [Candidatus Jordarchaeaceae archaeon]